MTTWLNVLNWTNFDWHLRALFLSFHMLCQISNIRLVTSLRVWVQGLKMLKEFVYPWTQPWSFSQKCSCFIHIRPFCLICAKTQTLVSLSIMVANIALPCVFSNKVDPTVHYTTVSVRARGFTGCQVPGVPLL